MKLRAMPLLLALTLGAYATVAGAQDIVVIVNPANATASMTVDQVQEIYLGKTSSLPSGGNAGPADLPEGSAVRDAFYQKVAGKSSAQVKAVWVRLLFSGKSAPPKTLDNSAAVKQFVAANANAIGYIEKSAADSSVKTVLSLP